MAEGRRMPTAWRQARQVAIIAATGTSGAWKVQVWGATCCMVGWAMAIKGSTFCNARDPQRALRPSDRGATLNRVVRGGGRLVDDDRRAGRRPVPQPDHVFVGNVDASVGARVFAGRVVVRAVGAGTIARAPGGVVDPIAAVEPHHHLDLAVGVPVGRALRPGRM